MEIFREQSPDQTAVLMGSYIALLVGLPAQFRLLSLPHFQKSNRHKAILLPFSTTCASNSLSTLLGYCDGLSPPGSSVPYELMHVFSSEDLSLSRYSRLLCEEKINKSIQDDRHISCY